MERVVETTVWWGLLLGVWVLTLSTIPVVELAVAAAAALPCALAAVAGRRAVAGCWRVRPRWLRWAFVLPVAVVADACRVLVVPLRPHARTGSEPGELREVPLAHDPDPARANGHRALAAAVVSVTPGTYVVDDVEQDRLVAHSLVDGPPRMDEVVRS